MNELAAKHAGACGILGVVLGAIGFFLTSMWRFPATNAPPPVISEFVSGHRSELVIGMIFSTGAVTLWMAFGVGLWWWLRRGVGGESPYSALFLVGVVSFTTLLLAGFTAFMVLVYRDGSSDARVLYDLGFGLLAMSGAPTFLALGAYAELILRTRVLPTYTAVLALVSAAAHVALFASFGVRSGVLSLEGEGTMIIPGTLFVWIAVTGGVLMREANSAGGRAAATKA